MLKKLFSNIYFLSLLKKANTIIFGLIASIFLNRALGLALKGEYASVYNIISTLTAILYLGISTIYPNYVRKKEKWTFSTFAGLVVVQFLFYSVLSVFVGFIMQKSAYILYGMCIAFAVFATQILQMSIVNDFKKGTYANIISVSTNALFLFFMWLSGIKSVNLALTIYLIKELSIVLFAFISFRKEIHIKDIEIKQWGKIIATGLIPMLTNLMVVFNYKVDVIILELLHIDSIQIGLYATGLSLAEYGWVISDIFKDVIVKKTALKDDVDSVSFCLRMSTTFLVLIGMILMVCSKLVLTILYGADYADAWMITDVVFIGVISMSYCKLLGPLFLANGRWMLYFVILSATATINIITNFLLIPVWGIYGAALTSVVSYSFAGLTFVLLFIKQYHVSVNDILVIRKNDIKLFKNLLMSRRKKIS